MSGRERLIPALIVILFLVQTLAPFMPTSPDHLLDLEPDSKAYQSTGLDSNATSHDLGGSTLVVDGITYDVRPEINLDYWLNSEIYNSSDGQISMYIAPDGNIHACSIDGSDLNYHLIYPNNTVETDLVQTSIATDEIGDCAITFSPTSRVMLAYSVGDDLKVARLAVPNAVYMNQTWHTRTIAEDIVDGGLNIVSDSENKMHIIFQDVDLALHHIWFNGAFWDDSILDSGPIGPDIAIEIDSNDTIHAVYTQTAEKEVRLVRFDQNSEVRQTLSRNNFLGQGIGMDLDFNALEQVAYSYSDGQGNGTVSLLRSLVGEDQGRIDPNEKWSIQSADDVVEPLVLYGDINADGKDDLVYSNPIGNGTISIHLGSSTGPASNADQILIGPNSASNLGMAIALGDYNCDGYDDLAASEPGMGNNSSGYIHITLGSSSGLANSTWWNMSGGEGDGLGWSLTTIGDIENDGCEDLAVVSNLTYMGDIEEQHGAVMILSGNSTTMNHSSNLTQSYNGPMFGRVIAGGDYNGDGFDDLVISNTGTSEEPLGYSSVEFFNGSQNGLASTPSNHHEPLEQGRLYGTQLSFVGDINGDGIEDLMISELFASTTPYHSGKIHLWEGSSNGPFLNWSEKGSYANALFGTTVSPAGDINEDGYDDFLVMAIGNAEDGLVELYLGGPNGPRSDTQTFAQGSNGERTGLVILTGMDLDGDGMNDILYSSRDLNRGDSFGVDLKIKTERDWEFIEFQFEQEIIDLEMKTGQTGSPALLVHLADSSIQFLEHSEDGTPAGRWAQTTLGIANALTFDVSHAGKPIIIHHYSSTLNMFSPQGNTALEYSLSANDLGSLLNTAVDSNGLQRIGHAFSAYSRIYHTIELPSGWTTTQVRDSVDLSQPVQIHIDSNDLSNLIYVDDQGQVELATLNSSWTLTQLANTTIGDDFDSLMLENDNILLAQIIQSNASTVLQIIEYDENITSTISNLTIANISDKFELDMVNSTTIGLSWLDGSNLKVMERNLSGGNWTLTKSLNLFNVSANASITMSGSSILFESDTLYSGILTRDLNGNWSSTSFDLPTTINPFEFTVDGQRWHITSTNSNDELVWTTGTIGSIDMIHSYEFPAITLSDRAPMAITANGSLSFVFHNDKSLDFMMMRFITDSDRDLIPDSHDQLPLIGGQWQDSDGDGFGNSAMGPLTDDCPNTAGTSIFDQVGCDDYDLDGWSNAGDDCVNDDGMSWWGRNGCDDYDQDGWADNDAFYSLGDRYPTNWKQALDSDGDTYGDNHGPDCCNTQFDNKLPDLFPYNSLQWKDDDNDGYGDNEDDAEFGDKCPWIQGFSWRDRLGCVDSDGDGSSDVSGVGTHREWNESHGADWWPTDETQWADSDGDGFGDNSTEGATTPDKFPSNPTAANDTDEDGYPNNWTSLDNVSLRAPLEIDGCPNDWGNSTSPQFGCTDTDGDGVMDAADDYPLDPTQVADSDGDGWGDAQGGTDPDKCPFTAGVWDGTLGVGCPIINDEDDDGDSILNDYDNCEDTEIGLEVDAAGCAENQKDDDQDGIANDLDKCPGSESGVGVDLDGCTTSQAEVDSDSDGVNDPSDGCPQTEIGADVDANGCADAQLDDDEDGVSNAEDACPDTPPGYLVLSDGCTDEAAMEVDFDDDGFSGVYSYSNGIHSGDAFPRDATQWWDQDRDGFGDNDAQNATTPDDCPDVWGNSTEKFRYGCVDSDGDGYEDIFDDPFPNDKTQWIDEDLDGFGDNSSGNNADKCLATDVARKSETVGYDGCASNQRDSDSDGVLDIDDRCADTPSGAGVDPEDGCQWGVDSEAVNNSQEMIFGLAPTMFYIAAGGGGLVILLILIVLISKIAGGDDDDDDDDDDDWDDDEDDEDDFMSSVMGGRSPAQSTPPRSGPEGSRGGPSPGGPQRGPGGPSPGGPQRGPGGPSPGGPQRGPGGPSPGGPQRGPSGPQRGPGGPQRGPSSPSQGGPPRGPGAATAVKVSKKKAVSGENRVRKAKPKIDPGLFEASEITDRTAAVSWCAAALKDGEAERSIMMQLQSTGWSAPQSRAIVSLAQH
ncbi:MAG: FG-GAP-like repeat-containing protein [Candidatus Poseidoniales archaeon]